MKKITFYSELVYISALVLLSFAVSMISATDFGLSMIVSPAYILSLKFPVLTFGQAEYVVQGILFVLFCILLKKIRAVYFVSFGTGFVYGLMLDAWRLIIPHFNPEITAPGSLPLAIRIVYFILGMLLTSLSIAMCFRTYLYPQIYDFFVKGVSEKYSIDSGKFKTAYDFVFLIVSVVMSLLLFGKFVGVGIGTPVMAICNGFIITFFGKIMDKIFVYKPLFKKFSTYFEI